MNIIRMTGGMGNQMFQYALFLKLTSLGREVKFDDVSEYEGRDNARPYMLFPFGIKYPRATEEEIKTITDGFMYLSHRIRRKILGRKTLEYHEKDCNFDSKVLEKDPAYLTGYFQSDKYFEDIVDQVRATFTFTHVIFDNISGELMEKVREYENKTDGCYSVSIHIRRGDYLESDEVYGGICTQIYYERAIALIRKHHPEAVFFVFSNEDDFADRWCHEKEDTQGGTFIPVLGFSEDMGYLAMYLMCRCRSHIIANSSFSWWGAYLNPRSDKMVIAPSKWFNHQDCEDIYTKDMIKITAKGDVLCPQEAKKKS